MKHKTAWMFILWILIFCTAELPILLLADSACRSIAPDVTLSATEAIFIGVSVLIVFIDLYAIISIVALLIARAIINKAEEYVLKKKGIPTEKYFTYAFINNSLLLTMKNIEKHGFKEIYRQENEEHSIQIICYNSETCEFKAFDRFHHSDEPYVDEFITYKDDLWTPIKVNLSPEWFMKHLK